MRCCEWMDGERLRRLSPFNLRAWRLSKLVTAISPADFNGNPTLSGLSTAVELTPGAVGEYELQRLVRRVCLIFAFFWLPYTAERREQQKEHGGS